MKTISKSRLEMVQPIRDITDEYESSQLNPVVIGSNPKADAVVAEQIDNLTEEAPVGAAMAINSAVFDAIIENEIEDKLQEDPAMPEEQVSEELLPMIENAETLRLVERDPNRLRKCLMHVRRSMTTPHMIKLLEKVADNTTNAFVEVDKACCKADTEACNCTCGKKPNSIGTHKDINAVDVGEVERVNIQKEELTVADDKHIKVEDAPAQIETAMRYHAVSKINSRKATAIMMTKMSPVAANALYQLRHVLPQKVKEKYNF